MDQESIDRQEWEDGRNWTGPRWLAIYASRRDRRFLVPKRIPWMGWTVNMAHPGGPFVLTGLIILVVSLCTICCKNLLGA